RSRRPHPPGPSLFPYTTLFRSLSLATTPIGGPSIPPVSVESRPRVEVWTDRGDSPYTSGQGVRTHFRADRDAFVTILRVDTDGRSEEHTSELQSRENLVCRLLL